MGFFDFFSKNEFYCDDCYCEVCDDYDTCDGCGSFMSKSEIVNYSNDYSDCYYCVYCDPSDIEEYDFNGNSEYNGLEFEE